MRKGSLVREVIFEKKLSTYLSLFGEKTFLVRKVCFVRKKLSSEKKLSSKKNMSTEKNLSFENFL